MEKILKKDFCLLMSIKPNSLIGKEIAMKDGRFVKIIDISLGGNYMFIRGYDPEPKWIGIDTLDNEFIIDSSPKSSDIVSVKKLGEMNEKISKSSKGRR